MTLTRQNRKSAIFALLLLAGAATGFLMRWFEPLPPWALAAIITAVIVLCTWGSFYCWRLMDEAQKEAHKWAWYWGGSFGLIGGFIVMVVALRIDPHLAELVKPNGT